VDEHILFASFDKIVALTVIKYFIFI